MFERFDQEALRVVFDARTFAGSADEITLEDLSMALLASPAPPSDGLANAKLNQKVRIVFDKAIKQAGTGKVTVKILQEAINELRGV